MQKYLEEHIDFVSFPMLFLALVYFDRFALFQAPIGWLALMALGWIIWTFAEYMIHRWVLHTIYWMGIHELHHKRPRMMTRFPLWQVPSYFAVVALVAYALLGADRWVPVFAGVVLGYVCFFTMHMLMHHFPRALEDFAIRHNAHHKTTTCNYGITVDWWDRVFRTFRRPSKCA